MEVNSRADAKAHIAKIRHDKGLSEGDTSRHNVSDLENALTTLSDQLYQSSTHFLLELIQNADDNSYDPKVQPSVQFTYANGGLRVDCNEIGFSPRNVEALCRVGQSTKKGGDNATRYVGEKGIGFKSVFKAADVVWISSGHYSFKFDKNKELGMIAPIWDEFPVQVKPGFTSLYLQLSQTYNRRGLLDELRSLDSRLLIFLRRLQSITVSITEVFSATWINEFSRTEIGKDLIRLVENKKTCDYIIKRHHVSDMPPEAKRDGLSTSEIILGFPIGEDNQPVRESQQAYAFLPIRDYGFEFLIQADFLLIASREDIDGSSNWNHHLRNELYTAFLGAMKEFNKGDLRYLWPRYLPAREPLDSFLKPFHLDIREKLALQPVFYSHSGDLEEPKSLTYVPEEYTFNGAPMTVGTNNTSQYLSARYSEADLKYFEVLGVKKMSEEVFFQEFSSILKNSIGDFKKKSNAWHSHLAGILVRLSATHSPQLSDLMLVPLSDGSWSAAAGRQILFAGDETEFKLPGGLQLSIVQAEAAADPARRTLFKTLGVGDLAQEPVVRHVQELHKDGRASSKAINSEALISQIHFLYSANWTNPTFQRFWFTTESGQRFHGSQLYQDSSRPHSATKFFRAHRKKFPFIDKGYLAAGGKDADHWTRWLEEKMEVATIPRLVQRTVEGGFALSDDFEFIIKNFPSSEVLLLLRDNWEAYSKYFDPGQVLTASKEGPMLQYTQGNFCASVERLKQKLGCMLVTCKDGRTHRLDTTFLPTHELLVASQDEVPFLDVPDAENTSWHVLKLLGVSTSVDISFYLRCLEGLVGSADEDRIGNLFNSIQLRSSDKDGTSIVKTFFGTKNLVYIPVTRDDRPHQWVSLSQCRWRGPPVRRVQCDFEDMKTFYCLKDIYPGNQQLFCEVLGVQDVTLKDLVQEVKKIAVGDSLAHITSLFHAIEQFLEKDDTKSYLDDLWSLRTQDIFPVSKNWKQDALKVSALQNKFTHEWFIADTAPLRTIFAGVVPLLDIKVDDLAPMNQVLSDLGVKSRFLSRRAKSVPRIQGVVALNQQLTDSFRSKVDFIIRLIPTEKHLRQKRREAIEQLRRLQVYTADEVIQEWCVEFKGKTVKGPPGNGQVALAVEDDILKIYLAAKSGVEIGETPIELVDEMFNFCGMLPHSPEHSEMCLHLALSQNNTSRIMKVFADKGIPSLDSLQFADVEAEEGDSKDEKDGGLGSKERGYGYRKNKKKRDSRILKVAGMIIALPVGAAIGLGSLVKGKQLFDGKIDSEGKKVKVKKPKVKMPPKKKKEKKPKVPKVKEPRNGQGMFDGVQTAVSRNWLSLKRSLASEEAIAFEGELAVHRALADTLGQNYNPRHHWTSKLRSKANLPAFFPGGEEENYSTFKFWDATGVFTQLLIDDDFPKAKDWLKRPPTYHIDVKSTKEDVHTEFAISPQQFERARDLSIMTQQMKGDVDSIPKDVYILARVFQVDTIPRDEKGKGKGAANMVFLVDPWEYYHADKLHVQHKGKLMGSIV